MSISRLFKNSDFPNVDPTINNSFHGIMIDEKRVDVVCIGMDCVDSTLKDAYDNVNELPEWVQLKIAVLMACQDGHTIDTIGRRVDDSTFWIYGGEE